MRPDQNTPVPPVRKSVRAEVAERSAISGGRPAAFAAHSRPDLVMRHVRDTRDAVKTARRLGVRVNDVLRVVLDEMDRMRRAS